MPKYDYPAEKFLTPSDYAFALNCGMKCDSVAYLSDGLNVALQRLQQEGYEGDKLNKHPIVVLIAMHFLHLAGGYANVPRSFDAEKFCRQRAQPSLLRAKAQIAGDQVHIYVDDETHSTIGYMEIDNFPETTLESVTRFEEQHKCSITNYDKESKRFML